MDFELSEELKIFQTAIRDFAQKEIAPLVKTAEENEETPRELFAKMGRLGYLCPDYPEELGGGGLGKIAECMMVEEVAKVCSGIASGILTQSGLATRIIAKHGNEKLQVEYLIPSVKGEKIASFGLTESEAGSDAANIQTTATKKGDQYILKGGKIYITNGQYCDYVVVAALTDKSQGAKGISIFIMDSDTPGFSRTKMKKLGNHASVTSQFFFDDCAIPAENLVGEEGRGFKYVLEALNSARISHSARSVGTAQAALEASINYAKERVQFGQPIGKFQAIAFKIAEKARLYEPTILYCGSPLKRGKMIFNNELPCFCNIINLCTGKDSRVDISRCAKIEGFVYSRAPITHLGEISGFVYCNGFLQDPITPDTTNTNIVSGIIKPPDSLRSFLIPVVFQEIEDFKILKWQEF